VRKPTVRLHRLHRLQFVDWSDCQLHKLRSTHELTISTLIQWARDTAERTVYHQLPPDTHQPSITRTHVFSSGFDFWRYRRSSLTPVIHHYVITVSFVILSHHRMSLAISGFHAAGKVAFLSLAAPGGTHTGNFSSRTGESDLHSARRVSESTRSLPPAPGSSQVTGKVSRQVTQ